MKIMGEKTELLQRLVSASDVRQNVISQNIANVNTTGYKAQEGRFEDQLTAELQRRSRRRCLLQSRKSPPRSVCRNATTAITSTWIEKWAS